MNNISRGGLANVISRNSHIQGDQQIAAFRYDKTITEILESGDRYQNAEQILSFGRKIPDKRYKEIEAILLPNLKSAIDKIGPAMKDKAWSLLENPAFRAMGMKDFLGDLQTIMDQEILALGKDVLHNAKDYGNLGARWGQIEKEVTDVVTRDSALDAMMDKFKLNRTKALYISFLNEAEDIILAKVRNDLTLTLLTQIRENAISLLNKANGIFGATMDATISLLQTRYNVLATDLYVQEQGQADDVENICSFNIMTQEWRKSFLANRQELKPENILNELIQEKNKNRWRPGNMMELATPSGVKLADFLAQEVLDRMEILTQSMREMTPVKVLQEKREYKGKSPEEAVANLYYTLLQPQMRITAMRNRLGRTPHTLLFCGGINSAMKAVLQAQPQLQNATLNISDNLEQNRINFFTSTLPIAMAGCDSIITTFEEAYNNWHDELMREDKKTQEYELALFQCYQGSHRWRRPSYFIKEVESNLKLFARALAISEMLELQDADLLILNGFGSTPKDKRYSIFQIGSAQFWLTPFFIPSEASTKGSSVTGKMIRLGTNVEGAYKTLSDNELFVEQARNWVNWFGAAWSKFYNAHEVLEKKKRALNSLLERKGKTDDAAQVELWDSLISALDNWEEIGK
jgi:hypothetical protein